MFPFEVRQNLLLAALLTQLVGLSMFLMSYYGGSIPATDTARLLIYMQIMITMVWLFTGIGKSLEFFWAFIHIAWYVQGEEYRLSYQDVLFFIALGLVLVSVFLYLLAMRGKMETFQRPTPTLPDFYFRSFCSKCLGSYSFWRW
ncbi:MAG: hypothetical protein IPN95_07480 [Bacteroidetes bacterium]|nr:hypothetical protein [Bacteroidota bacterium]